LNSFRISSIQEQELACAGQDVTLLHVRPKSLGPSFCGAQQVPVVERNREIQAATKPRNQSDGFPQDRRDKVAKLTLTSLGISQSAAPILKSFLDVQDKLQRIRQVHSASTAAPTGDRVIGRFVAVRSVRGPKGAKKDGAPHPQVAKSAAAAFHEVRRLLDERAFYPAHDARKESSAYAKVHKALVKEGRCLICGVTNEVLKKQAKRENLNLNPYAAKQLETHHHVIEWALANAIDTDKFNKLVFPHLKARHPERYTSPLTTEEVKAWVDHSPDNLWILCDVHHRAKWFGIHEITDPLWGPQDIFSNAFLDEVRKAIGGTKKPSSGKPTRSKAGNKK
jgi:hypothetical protein